MNRLVCSGGGEPGVQGRIFGLPSSEKNIIDTENACLSPGGSSIATAPVCVGMGSIELKNNVSGGLDQ